MSTLIKYFAMDVMRMIRLAHWKLYKIAEKYPKYMYRYSIAMERLKLAIPWNASSIWNEDSIWITKGWKVVAKPQKMPGFLASRGEEFNPGPVTKLDGSEVLCYKVLLNYKRDRESCWHRQQNPLLAFTATSSRLIKERQCLREWHQAPHRQHALR